jgi:hypothetical protein
MEYNLKHLEFLIILLEEEIVQEDLLSIQELRALGLGNLYKLLIKG